MRLLFTGATSYIANSLKNWLSVYSPDIQTDVLSLRDESWRDYPLSTVDVVFHAAGIAHADVDKVNDETQKLYFKVNAELAYEFAQKCKEAGVKHFIYMSSVIIYHTDKGLKCENRIASDTVAAPMNFYGESKLKGENLLNTLKDEAFKLSVIRCPMVYGKGSKGNFKTLEKLSEYSFFFPDITNKRSMIFIDNLCEFLRLLIVNGDDGVFYPQNNEYVSTKELVAAIRATKGRKTHFIKLFNPVIYLLSNTDTKVGRLINKAFGSLYIDKELSAYKDDYCVTSFNETIRKTED